MRSTSMIAAAALVTTLYAQTTKDGAPATPATFDAISIKLNKTGDRAIGMFPTPGMLTVKNYPLRLLIQGAYGLRQYELAGGPAWLSTEHYDIVAKAAGPAKFAQMVKMLVPVLEERFQLKVHRETRELPGYVLTVAKGGPKFGRPNPDDTRPAGFRMPPGEASGHKVGMMELVVALVGNLGMPVVDKTGLEGEFDFEVHYTPDVRAPGDAADASSDPGPGSLVTALREQLGLKAEVVKMPVEVTVIDHVERAVLEN